MLPIDLRSDTVTRPTEAMMAAMAQAPLGDDSRDGDPTVGRLEQLAAQLTGKDAALFVPSGTMGNLVALMSHAQRGSQVLVDAGAHLLTSEMGGLVAIAGIVPQVMPSRLGRMDEAAVATALTAGHAPGRLAPGLVWLETSHNDAGGLVLPLDHVARLGALARRHGVPLHIDGARLFNAAVALGVPAATLAGPADSVMFCVSKGLSAPVGSLLAGSQAFVARARALRRMVGGSLRQSGVIAAAGIVALETMIGRLAEDHRMARRLASGLAAIDAGLVETSLVETNIVKVDLAASGLDAATWTSRLATSGVLVQPRGGAQLRLVTHRHIDAAAVDMALSAFAEVARQAGTAR
ncbi:MAG: aminotransferase class I/II-fold pyridoxal phosphate-dependent enzyme [Rhizobiales bacterium]|nr:aminotransferase class I/II-fold pyridoxal phosphate-dependent enzyme [Hyphomicrobiales bacterium]